MIEIQVRDVPEQPVVSDVRTVVQAELEPWLREGMARVAERAGHPDGLVFIVIYEGNPNLGPVPVEVCATVATGGDRTIPAHREAFARVTKELVTSGQLGTVYEAIEKWIVANGFTVAVAPRETYWTDFMSAAPGDEVFDVAFPIT